MSTRRFGSDFLWGTATASYQIEGGVREDGRGPSIWDTFAHTPGAIAGGATGDVACDHFHRMEDDVKLLADLGVGAYRFSVAWSRIQPTGSGPVKKAGLDFYSRLIDRLGQAGIAPSLTMYHWDLPQGLEDAGGWPVRDTAYRFADYAEILATAFGDRVAIWSTLNEPWCSAFLGYGNGTHAPGRHDPVDALRAAHHLNLAHGLGTQAVAAIVGPAAKASVAINVHAFVPASPAEEDHEALRRIDAVANRVFLDPMLEGAYPAELLEGTAHITDWAFVRPGDLDAIHQPLWALGVNYYMTNTVRRVGRDGPVGGYDGHVASAYSPWVGADDVEFVSPAGPRTAMGWNICPEGLTDLLIGLHRSYPGIDLMVTENGAAFDDVVTDGTVHDPRRVAYLHDHIEAVGTAMDAGVPVKGYFAWSLLDNFEWARGYDKRFGLIRVDYETQERIWKDSGRWYRQLASTGTVPPA